MYIVQSNGLNQAVLFPSVHCALPLQIMPLYPWYVRFANILGQSVPRASGDDGGSDTDTIPYGRV